MDAEQMNESIAPDLVAVDAAIEAQLRSICTNDALLEEIFTSFFHGRGKKLRPRLVLLSAFALRQDNLRAAPHAARRQGLIDLAAVIELVHSASLMHDDVLDGAATRRRRQSLNARFGNKAAILAGDILYSRAFELLVAGTDRDTALQLTQCVRRMCGGEIISLSEHGLRGYLKIIEDKTASLMTFCCQAGVAAVRRDGDADEVLQALGVFGHSFGMAYQLADDLWDNDSPVAIAHRERVIGLLREYIRSADEALEAAPPSVYRKDLSRLVRYVESRSAAVTGGETTPPERTLAATV